MCYFPVIRLVNYVQVAQVKGVALLHSTHKTSRFVARIVATNEDTAGYHKDYS